MFLRNLKQEHLIASDISNIFSSLYAIVFVPLDILGFNRYISKANSLIDTVVTVSG
jgi:hypothetical protein